MEQNESKVEREVGKGSHPRNQIRIIHSGAYAVVVESDEEQVWKQLEIDGDPFEYHFGP